MSMTSLSRRPPHALHGRMLYRFRADSLFWNTVHREAAALLPPTPLVASRDDTPLGGTTTVPASLTFESAPLGSRWYASGDTAGFQTGDAILIESGDVTSSCGLRVPVSRGGITFVAASSEWRRCTLALRRQMFELCQFGLTLVVNGFAHFRMPSTRWKNTPCTTSNPRTTDHALAFCLRLPEGSSGQWRDITGGEETSNGAVIIGPWSRRAPLLF